MTRTENLSPIAGTDNAVAISKKPVPDLSPTKRRKHENRRLDLSPIFEDRWGQVGVGLPVPVVGVTHSHPPRDSRDSLPTAAPTAPKSAVKSSK
jgi:hypothetical protein